MTILAIDPGSNESGVVRYDEHERRVESAAVMSNSSVLAMLRMSHGDGARLVIEEFENYGRATGVSTRDAIRWSGRFQEAWEAAGIYTDGDYVSDAERSTTYLTRRTVKVHLCGGMSYRHPDTGQPMKIGDREVRGALLERFPATGGGRTPEVGTKSSPGPCYGVKSHCWSALALAVVLVETEGR